MLSCQVNICVERQDRTHRILSMKSRYEINTENCSEYEHSLILALQASLYLHNFSIDLDYPTKQRKSQLTSSTVR
jgi:hypothetical protein